MPDAFPLAPINLPLDDRVFFTPATVNDFLAATAAIPLWVLPGGVYPGSLLILADPALLYWLMASAEVSMKAILIKSCSDSRLWYAGLVGQTVPFLGDMGDELRSRQPSGYINFVRYHDCEIVLI